MINCKKLSKRKNLYGKKVNIRATEEEEMEHLGKLSTKISRPDAVWYGFYDASPLKYMEELEKRFLGLDTTAYEEARENVKLQNDTTYTISYTATEILEFFLLSWMMRGLGAVQKGAEGIGSGAGAFAEGASAWVGTKLIGTGDITTRLGNALLRNSRGINSRVASVIEELCLGTAGDMMADTLPGAIDDSLDGKPGREVVSRAIESIKQNLKYGLMAEGTTVAVAAGIDQCKGLIGYMKRELGKHFGKTDEAKDLVKNVTRIRLSTERVTHYLNQALNNVESDTAILGITGNYDVIGETQGYTYFKMDDIVWSQLENETMKNYDEIWKVNKQFIDNQIKDENRILLSNNPYQEYCFNNGEKRFYQRELDYLKELGFSFEYIGDNLWEVTK